MDRTDAQRIANQVNTLNTQHNAHPAPTHTEKAPPLLTKKWLAQYFGFMRPRGNVYYQGLYRHVLTPEVLQAAGLTIETVRHQSLKTFDRSSSILLIKILGLPS